MTARQSQLAAERKCIQCRAGLLDHEITRRCDECKTRNKKRSSRKMILARYAKRAKAKYWRDPEKNRKKLRDRVLTKKLDAECRDCSLPALEDSDWCRTHRQKHRASSRAAMQRLRARLAGTVAT